MGLNSILKRKEKPKVHSVKNIPLFLPPEYSLDLATWREYIRAFNATEKQTRLGSYFVKYIQDREPTKKNFDNLVSISEIVEVDGNFYTTVHFENDRAGLTALVLFKAEKLIVAPICLSKETHISHVSITYPPSL